MMHLFVNMSVESDNLCFWRLIYEKVEEKGDTHWGGNYNQRSRYYITRSLLEFMTIVSRGKVWGNDGRLCGRGVEETMKEMTKDGTSGSPRLTDRGFALIRWGICRRHTNQPTAYFYGPQFSCASIPGSFTTSLHPLIPYFHGPRQCGWVVLIYISVHVCALCTCIYVWSIEAAWEATVSILHIHNQLIPTMMTDFLTKIN